MKVNDIRNKKIYESFDKYYLKDVKLLMNLKKKFIEINCPCCSNKNYNTEFKKNGFNFVRCGFCNTLFVNPRPTIDMLEDFYRNSETIKFFAEKILKASEEKRRQTIFKPRVQKVIELCEKFKTNRRLLVNIGAGNGIFCAEMMNSRFFECVLAVEPSDDMANECRKKNIPVLNDMIEQCILKNIDVITNFELLEHLFEPGVFLKACAEKLKKNGLMIITTVCIEGFDLSILGKFSDNIRAPQHLNYFSKKGIRILFEKSGFSIIEILTPGKLDVELVKLKVEKNPAILKNNIFLKNAFFSEYADENIQQKFQEFISNSGLSSHMWIVAKRK